MTRGPRAAEPGAASRLLEALARLFRAGDLDVAMLEGTRLLAQLGRSADAAVFLVRGEEATEQWWHETRPGTRARLESCFTRAAIERAAGRGALEATTPCGTRYVVATSARDAHPVLAAVFALPDEALAAAELAATAEQALALLAARATLHEGSARFEAQRARYERWFRTLDHQLRLLDRERQKFAAIVHQSDIHVFVADVEGNIRWTNKAMTHLAPGAAPGADWIGKRCSAMCGALRGAEGPCTSCPVALALRTNEPAHHELHASRHGASRTFYVTALPIRGPDGRPQEAMVMLQDLTDLRIVRRSEARYRRLFERSTNAIVMVDPERRTLLIANAMTARMLGWEPDQLPGRPLQELIVPEEWPRFEERWSRLVAAGTPEGFECRLRVRGGDERHVVVTPSRFDLDGEQALLLEFLDVTERRRAEAALVEREQQLRQSQKLEAVGRLAGGIAHGFNNLLAVIMGRAGLIRDRLPPEHAARRDAEQIHNACVQGSWLTRHLLAFSRKEVAAPRVVDLRSVVTEMDGMLRCLLGEPIELVTVAGVVPTPVIVDPAQIEQVLLNLVINARDALPEGGSITVELAHVRIDDATARDRGIPGGPFVRLTVRDDGIGMDEETRGRVFEPFFTTKERGKGSGLGMSIVYGTVSQAGGHVEVSSEAGMGTSVAVFLPLSNAPAPAAVELAPVAPAAVGGETVLVVEDDDPVRAVTCETLELEGYTVISAANGREALALVERHDQPIHLMVTDVVMPGMSGGELARRLAVLRPDTRVIFVSGYVDDVIVREGVTEGAAFLQKPFPLEALAAKAREVLDGNGARPAS